MGRFAKGLAGLLIAAGLPVFTTSTPVDAAGTVSLTAVGVAHTEDFNTLAASGATSDLPPTGWWFAESGTNANTTYGVSTGSISAGNTYSFGAATDPERAFGGLRSGSLVPVVGAQFTNNTGSTITSVAISYTGEQWRLGQNTTGRAADRLDFQFSLDATSLTNGIWSDHDGLDFASPVVSGTDVALNGNAAANRTALSSTISGLGIPPDATLWIRWNDSDLMPGADDGLAIDDFSITPSDAPSPPNLSLNDVSAQEGDSATTTFEFVVTLSAPAGAGGVTFDIATADNTATVSSGDYAAQSLTGQTIPQGATTYTFSVLVNGDEDLEANESFFVNVTNVVGANVVDSQGSGTIVNDDLETSRIHDIQGPGSSVTGAGPFMIDAIVVGDYQTQGSGQLRGFFVQEEDADADANPATSEGLFVFCSSCPTAVAVGDHVRVTGSASEFFDMSQLTASSAASVTVLSSGNPLPTPASVQLPVPDIPTDDPIGATTAINAYFEAFEGMLVTFPDTLSVTEYFELARYGQVELTAGGRPHTFTAVNDPSAQGLVAHTIELATRTIILDDTDNRQNRPIDVPNTAYYHPAPGLSTSNYFRGGDTITKLTGVLHWSFAGQSGTDAWRIRPVTEAFPYAFTPTNPRPDVPDVDGSLRVASFNVLNYFLTIDTTDSNNVGSCGPTQTMDCRGADSPEELQRQRTKLLQALTAIDADVVGLMEMENTPGVEPLADIVAGLPGYAYVDTGVTGSDAIRVGIIYRTDTVQPVGNPAVLDAQAFVNPRNAEDDRNRPAVAQTFEEIATGGRLTVVVNHLKSKGSGCGAGDDDTTTGQGNCNLTRTLAAHALADWLATDPTGSGDADVLIIGDLNSYAREDPIVALQDAGYTDLIASFGGPAAYGYVFDGQLGYLDHALSNPNLTPQVAGVDEWHINADEIPLLDYNDDERTAGEAPFEEESATLPLYEPNEFRTSDHDPVIVGLDLNGSPACAAARADKTRLVTPNHKMTAIEVLGVTDPDDDPVEIKIDSIGQDEPVDGDNDGNTSPDGAGIGAAVAQVRAERDGAGNGRVYHIAFTATDSGGGSCTGEVIVEVPVGRNRAAIDDGPLYDSTVPA
jgi:predicted extracellular nuclease